MIRVSSTLKTTKLVPSKLKIVMELKKFKNKPKQMILKERIKYLVPFLIDFSLLGLANGIAIPKIKMKNGKTKSASLQPFHSA